jgi:hypothetical protein
MNVNRIKKDSCFIIPCLNPDEKLLDIVKSINSRCENKIFILDDGSKASSKTYFTELKINNDYANCIVLEHAVNLGKGSALKTCFNEILTEYPEINTAVTLDSDGQHSVDDSFRLLNELNSNSFDLIMGYREFSKEVPLKSYIGNNISRIIYKLVLGREFKDTQTGLRAFKKDFMFKCLSLKSNRFEFETEQLQLAISLNLSINELPIETIYIENNKSTSFHPVYDSFKIYFVLFRYFLSSILTALTDYFVFAISFYLGLSIMNSNFISRSFSIAIQFHLLKSYVFKSSSNLLRFLTFVIYVYSMAFFSSFLISSLYDNFQFSVLLSKIVVEGLMFFVNFAFVRSYIFDMN